MKNSQNYMLEHSRAKIKLLSLYMDRYLNIMNQNPYVSDIFIYDLFCGEGIYENGGKGSPIIFLEKIKNIYFANKAKKADPVKFHCLFNDKDQNKLKKLKNAIDNKNLHYPQMGKLEITAKDYRNILPKTVSDLESLNKEKAFVFLDPYGYKDIRAKDIKNLLESGKSEVLLFLPTQFMFRFEKEGTPESLKEFISELVPRDEWPKSDTGLEFIENLLDKFRDYLGKAYFVDSFIIARLVNQYFCLFFFTSHIRGFEKMLESKWKIDKEEGRVRKFKMENDLFSDQEKTPKTAKLKSKLNEFLQYERTNSEVFEFGLHQGYLATHITEILREFQAEGRLSKLLNDGTTARKNAFYVNYKNYKNAPSKVNLKLIV